MFQPLPEQHKTRPIPSQNFDSVGAPRPKHKNRPAEWIVAQDLADQGNKTIGAFAVMWGST